MYIDHCDSFFMSRLYPTMVLHRQATKVIKKRWFREEFGKKNLWLKLFLLFAEISRRKLLLVVSNNDTQQLCLVCLKKTASHDLKSIFFHTCLIKSIIDCDSTSCNVIYFVNYKLSKLLLPRDEAKSLKTQKKDSIWAWQSKSLKLCSKWLFTFSKSLFYRP